MGAATIFGIGLLTGSIVTQIIFRFFIVGILHVDTSDPEDNPYLFLELLKNVESITSKKFVILKVNIKSFVSHK